MRAGTQLPHSAYLEQMLLLPSVARMGTQEVVARPLILPPTLQFKDVSDDPLAALNSLESAENFERVRKHLDALISAWNAQVTVMRDGAARGLAPDSATLRRMEKIMRAEIELFAGLPPLNIDRVLGRQSSPGEVTGAESSEAGGEPPCLFGIKGWTLKEMSFCRLNLKKRFQAVSEAAKEAGTDKHERYRLLRAEALFARDLKALCDEDYQYLKDTLVDPADRLRQKFWVENETALVDATGGRLKPTDFEGWQAIHDELTQFRESGVEAWQPAVTFYFPDPAPGDEGTVILDHLEFAYQAAPGITRLFKGCHPGYYPHERVVGEYAALVCYLKQAERVLAVSSGDRQIIANSYAAELHVYLIMPKPKSKKSKKKKANNNRMADYGSDAEAEAAMMEEDAMMESGESESIEIARDNLHARQELCEEARSLAAAAMTAAASDPGELLRHQGKKYAGLDTLDPLEFAGLPRGPHSPYGRNVLRDFLFPVKKRQ